jgi:hypothetical protein
MNFKNKKTVFLTSCDKKKINKTNINKWTKIHIESPTAGKTTNKKTPE